MTCGGKFSSQSKKHLMTSNFILPKRLDSNNVYVALQQFLDANPVFPTLVNVDFSRVTFIRPPNVAFLSNFTNFFTQRGSKVNFSGMVVARQAIKYLDDSGFFETHLGERLHPNSRCRPTTFPLQTVARADSHGWLEFNFLPWLVAKSGLTKTSLAEVKTCIQELLNNICDHTQFDEGCIFGQWYPNENQIIVSIADFGIGIPENVRKVEPHLDDNAALIRAVQDGFSSMSLPSNRGAGLYLLLQNIVQNFNGVVTLRSGLGLTRFENRSGSIYVNSYTSVGYCIGTTIDLTIRTDQIPFAPEEENFEW